MKCNTWKLAAVGLATLGLSSAVVLGQNDVTESRVRRAASIDYSADNGYGTAAATDSDIPYNDPLWIGRNAMPAPGQYLTHGHFHTVPRAGCPDQPYPYVPYYTEYAPTQPQLCPCPYSPDCPPCVGPLCQCSAQFCCPPGYASLPYMQNAPYQQSGQPGWTAPNTSGAMRPTTSPQNGTRTAAGRVKARSVSDTISSILRAAPSPEPGLSNNQVAQPDPFGDPNSPSTPAPSTTPNANSTMPPETLMPGGEMPGMPPNSFEPQGQSSQNYNGGGTCNTCNCDSCNCGSCDCDCGYEEAWRLLGDCCCLQNHGLSIYGWVDGGIMGNGRRTPDRYNGPLTFPDRREGQLNQFYMVLERPIDKDNCGCAIGGRVDFLYGSDYYFTTAAGLDGTQFGNTPRWNNNNFLYGSAMPQMYVEAAYHDLRVKMGHFYTIIGYEVVPAIGNFFYSHSYTQQYGEPFTHTGVLFSQPANDCWTWSAGVVNGWDSFNTDTRGTFLGGLTYTNEDWGSLAFGIISGDESIFGPGIGPWANRTMYSLVWSRTFSNRLTYVLQHDYGNQDLGQFNAPNRDWYGLNQYAFYKLNCCWTAGARFEWFRDDDGYRVTGLRPGNAIQGASFPGSFYEWTLGLNYKPNCNLAIRPEVRWDWYQGLPNQNQGVQATSPYDAGTRNNQFTYGLDLVLQF